MEQQLPDDVLADVLRRLAPRFLAASRCVCKAWRHLVDDRRLLRAHLLPHSVAGIFLNFSVMYSPPTEFFCHPSRAPKISEEIASFDRVEDHCNGLLLVNKYWMPGAHHGGSVTNPTTRWWHRLPPRPPPRMGTTSRDDGCLVFDPAVSAHYEVLLIPRFRCEAFLHHGTLLDPIMEYSKWPPSPCVLHVFSSRTGQWEERSFLRQGDEELAWTIVDMRERWLLSDNQHDSVYWGGALYVHCTPNFVMRISSSDGRFQVIEPPVDTRVQWLHVGRTKKGVCCALFGPGDQLRVWILNKLGDQMEWELNYRVPLPKGRVHTSWFEAPGATWKLMNYHEHNNVDDIMEHPVEEIFEWSSDCDNDEGDKHLGKDFSLLGFHPYKEVVFLEESYARGLALDLNSSKIQELGNLCPEDYKYRFVSRNERALYASFLYTPCWM